MKEYIEIIFHHVASSNHLRRTIYLKKWVKYLLITVAVTVTVTVIVTVTVNV